MRITKKEKLPIEHFRRTMYLNKKIAQTSLGTFKYLPMAIHTVLTTIPMPWEPQKPVDLAYHHTGNICFISSKPKIHAEEYIKKWRKINSAMRSCGDCRCLSFPVFDDDEPFIDYLKIKDVKIQKNNEFVDIFNEYECELNDKMSNKESEEGLKNKKSEQSNGNGNSLGMKSKKNQKRNYYDIPLYKSIYLSTSDNLEGINRLIKNNKKNSEKPKTKKPHTDIVKLLKNTRFFNITKTEWLEAASYLIYQGHKVLEEVLRRKKITFLYLDYNFNLRNTRPLTTKERKRSRVGVSFHLTREILKLLKYIVDSHISFRMGHINQRDLCNTMKYIFNNVGIITGIYRYKYKTMKQIKLCKSLEQIAKAYEDNSWCEMWRIFVFMSRGYNYLLKRYIENLVDRLVNGREYRDKKVTKQRIESNYDLELKKRMISELSTDLNRGQVIRVLKHFNEAWKSWKAHIPYQINLENESELKNGGVNTNTESSHSETYGEKDTESFINKINTIIDKYIQIKAAWYINEAISNKKSKKDRKKKLGKVTRLFLKNEIERQKSYLKSPYLSPHEAVAIYKTTSMYFKQKNSPFIKFIEKNEERHLLNAIERLKRTASDMEKEFFESVTENTQYYINLVKKQIISQRIFREISVQLTVSCDKYIPVYETSYMERLADAFISSYLFYESEKQGIFPNYLQPHEDLDMKSLKHFCEVLSRRMTEQSILYECCYEGLMEKIDNNLLSRLLRIIIDPIIVDYIIARNNCKVSYKDISYTNTVGFLKGFYIATFIYKYYSLIIDLCVFGLEVVSSKSDIVRLFFREMNRIYVLVELDDTNRSDIITTYQDVDIEIENEKSHFSNLLSEDNDKNYLLSKSVHLEFATRLPKSLGSLKFRRCSFYPNIVFTLFGVDVYMGQKIHTTSSWFISTGLYANLAVSLNEIKSIESRIRHIVDTSTSCTFLKLVSKWNNMLLGFISHYREIIYDTPEVFSMLKEGEKRVKNVVKLGINTKMPIRFPPQLFYTPNEYGGLGMLSISGVNVDSGVEIDIPNIMDYIDSWTVEFEESNRVWTEFAKSGKIDIEKGIPRMSTLLQKNKTILYDRGYRLLSRFKRYHYQRYDPFYFTDLRHDGKLWNISGYFEDVMECFGGKEKVLEHTLFKATYSKKFDKLFWSEADVSDKKLTKAQKIGISQIPNRRFILWWSPTINRANVYVGYQVQLEPTGIYMHGKLPTLKLSFVHIFRNNLWCKIHESIVDVLLKTLNKYSDAKKEEVPARKSIKFNMGYADIALTSNFYVFDQPISLEDVLEKQFKSEDLANIKKLWIDLQLRWGDYDKRDIKKYAKTRYVENISNPLSKYFDKLGCVIALDLCYNTFSAYGYIDISLSKTVHEIMEQVIKTCLPLHILRERLRKTLQIYSSEIEVISDAKEMFGGVLILDERLIYTPSKTYCILDPETGNFYYKRVKKEEGKKAKHLRNCICEDVFKLAESLSKQYILVKQDMVDYMDNYLADYPPVTVKVYECKINFSKILRIEGITGIQNEVFDVVNLYKNWFDTSNYTNFCRLVLILQSYNIDSDILAKNSIKNFSTVLHDNDWIKAEKDMKDQILKHYCTVNNLTKQKFSQIDIRNIVFGFEIDSGSSFVRKDIALCTDIGDFTDYHLNTQFRLEESYNDFTVSLKSEEVNEKEIKIPKNILRIFAATILLNKLDFAVIISSDVISLAFIPQFSTERYIFSSHYVPDGFNYIGIVVNSDDSYVINKIIDRYGIKDPLIIIYKDKNYFVNRKYTIIGEEGSVFVPEVWNYEFMKEFYFDDLHYELNLGLPEPFYSDFHMIKQFLNFFGKKFDELEKA